MISLKYIDFLNIYFIILVYIFYRILFCIRLHLKHSLYYAVLNIAYYRSVYDKWIILLDVLKKSLKINPKLPHFITVPVHIMFLFSGRGPTTIRLAITPHRTWRRKSIMEWVSEPNYSHHWRLKRPATITDVKWPLIQHKTAIDWKNGKTKELVIRWRRAQSRAGWSRPGAAARSGISSRW